MGCWNETCAISRTPIFYGDNVVMIVINKALFKGYGNRPRNLEASQFGRDIERIEFGVYNDYGWLEELPGAYSEGMKDRIERGEMEAYERAIFIRRSVWDKVLSFPVLEEGYYEAVKYNIRCERFSTSLFKEPDTRPEEFWDKINDLVKIFTFTESCRVDILGGLAQKGSQYGDLDDYSMLLEVEKIAQDEWKKRMEEEWVD